MGSHTMETSPKRSGRKRRRRKRKAKTQGPNSLRQSSRSPSRNLGVAKVVIRKRNVQNDNKIAKQYLTSIIKGSCGQQTSSGKNKEEDSVDSGQQKGDVLEQTVDLCDDDSLVDNSNPSLVIQPSLEVESKKEAVTDLSKDQTRPVTEVIDLTESTSAHQGSILIDISEDESREKPNSKAEKDEIFVIGTFSNTSNLNNKNVIPSLNPGMNKCNSYRNLINCSDKLNSDKINKKRKYLEKQSVLDKIDNQNKMWCRRETPRPDESSCSAKIDVIGENIYVNSPVVLPSSGLRPIIIDGSNVAFVHSNSNFSCKRLQTCINYFKEKGHKVTAFVPQFRLSHQRCDDPQLLRKLERQGDVILTPSKKIDGRNIVPYDDRFIVQTAVLKGGVIVTRDNYNDLLKENPAWAETIKYRTLAFTWVDDVLMFPKDPLGEFGPTLEEFLRFN